MSAPPTVNWVSDRLGVRLHAGSVLPDARVLVGLALRRNPRRAQLLVSRVLGKHIPTDPRIVRAAGLLLGDLVADVLARNRPTVLAATARMLHYAVAGDEMACAGLAETAARTVGGRRPVEALVVGFAETATALGHCVADALRGADYLHSTRRPVPGFAVTGVFQEVHSHATDHLLLPADRRMLRGDRPLVLVDDELSTGRTVLNTIAAMHRLAPREHYVLATLVDVRPSAQAADLVAAVAALGARLDVVSLANATVALPADLTKRAAALCAEHPDLATGGDAPGLALRLEACELGWPADLPVGGRHGWGPPDRERLNVVLPGFVAMLADVVPAGRLLVLGTEEHMALPLRIAEALAALRGGDVAFSSTTRSPVLVVPEEGYAVRSALTFSSHDHPAEGPGTRFAYNLGGPADPLWQVVLVVTDRAGDTGALHVPGGLLSAVGTRSKHTVLLVTP